MMNVLLTEQELIANAVNGDLEAFNQLVLKYQHIVYRHAISLVDHPDSADDLTQESFIKAFQKIGGFRGGSFRAWLLTIVTNTSRDQWKKAKRRPTTPLVPEDPDGEELESPSWIADPTASVEATVQQNEENRHLYQMLEELPAVYRSVITLIDLQEMDYSEAAEILNIPLGTIKSRLARARMQMKEKLNVQIRNAVNCHAPALVAVY